MTENIFESLLHLDVNSKVDTKKSGGTSLSYLSWAWAWAEFKKAAPQGNYKVKWFDNGRGLEPFFYNPTLGFMVFTEVTVDDITHEMWLPVMDASNKAMKAEPYEYTVKAGKRAVNAATMFDINKTLMRCLVKNLAMFGLGLYIYAGEDIPEMSQEQIEAAEAAILEAKKQEYEKAMVQKMIKRAETLGYQDTDGLKGKSSEEIKKIMEEWKAESKKEK